MPFDAGVQQQDTALDVLERAKDYLEDCDHWCKGTLYIDERVCLVGALYIGAGCVMGAQLGAQEFARVVAVRSYIGLALLRSRWGNTDVEQFNDHPDTTHAEV